MKRLKKIFKKNSTEVERIPVFHNNNLENFSSEAVIETEINERTNNEENEEEELIGEQISLENESKIKNFLLIGGTGNGKSTLANVITGTNNFKESKKSVSKTRNIQSEMFEENENKYLIIDTPGFGDTQLALIRVLDIIAEAVYLVKDGISQVLFVIGNRFDQSGMKTYNLLRTIIFDEHVTNYTTIIRPCFENFKKEEKCKEDVDLMIRKKGELAEIIESCQRNVIHVNNPPLNIASVDNENEKQKKERMDDIKSNKRARNKSRVKILDNLSKCFQKVPYKPPKLKKLSTEIVDYMENKKELEKKLVDLKSNIIRKKKLINNITESQEFENKSDANKINIIDDFEEKIKQLESKKEILNKEIIVKKEIIRKKVLEHILNDIDKLEETFAEKIKKKENWTNIHKSFANEELIEKWIDYGFDYQQVQEWVKDLGESFNLDCFSLYAWLRDEKNKTAKEVKALTDEEIAKLWEEFLNNLSEEDEMLEEELRIINDWQKQWPEPATTPIVVIMPNR